MTETKFFEIRDVGTHIPAMCTKIVPDDIIGHSYVMRRAGFAVNRPAFILTNLCTMETTHDEFNWRSARTMPNAHRCIITHWDILSDGDVIDVEFFLGETSTKKLSERFHTMGETL